MGKPAVRESECWQFFNDGFGMMAMRNQESSGFAFGRPTDDPEGSCTRQAPSAGVLGAVGFGQVHLRELLRLQQEGRIGSIRAADPALTDRPEIVGHWAGEGVSVYGSFDEMVADGGLDVLTIATPASTHRELTRKALDLGLRVFLEKPTAPFYSEVLEMCSWPDAGQVAVNFHMLSTTPVRTLLAGVRAGEIGRVREVRVVGGWPRQADYYARNGWAGRLMAGQVPAMDGPATNALAHLLHLAIIVASPGLPPAIPETVEAVALRYRHAVSHDTMCLRARLDGGVRMVAGLTHAGTGARPYEMRVIGDLGEIVLCEDDLPPQDETGRFLHSPGFDDFAVFLEGKSSPAVSLADTLAFTALVNLAFVSAGSVTDCREGIASALGDPATDCVEELFQSGELPLESCDRGGRARGRGVSDGK